MLIYGYYLLDFIKPHVSMYRSTYASAIAQRAAEYFGSVEFNKLHYSIRALPGIKEFNRVQKAGLKMLL